MAANFIWAFELPARCWGAGSSPNGRLSYHDITNSDPLFIRPKTIYRRNSDNWLEGLGIKPEKVQK